ncbi:MAG: DUF1573 domain-containing protein [Planctomycetaceae bacterium]|jgi:hypothetical protein|nr:DUF1573 domain-containing protein [Planctomycetaceae bacterium]
MQAYQTHFQIFISGFTFGFAEFSINESARRTEIWRVGCRLKFIFFAIKIFLILLCAIVFSASNLSAQSAEAENKSNQNTEKPETDAADSTNKKSDEQTADQTANQNNSAKQFDDWTEYIIRRSDRQFDFKSIPAGMYSEHKFILSNPFQDVLHISGVSSSCACTSAFVLDGKDTLQTYDKTAIVARLRSVDNTFGQKSATITIRIDKPSVAEIQLNTYGHIRSDILFSPSELRFESVDSGAEKTRTLTVNYTGRNAAWKIIDIKSTNPHIESKIESTQVYPNQITSIVKVKLKSGAPDGEFMDRVILISNETESRRELPVVVRGRVGVTISVAPETVFFGYLKTGESSQIKSVLLKGTQPFKIKKLLCDNPAVQIAAEINQDLPAKQIHILPLRYTNPETGEGKPVNGKMEAIVKIETDLNNLTPTFKVLMESKE